MGRAWSIFLAIWGKCTHRVTKPQVLVLETLAVTSDRAELYSPVTRGH